MFVFSPSNMSTYRTCPRRFEGQSITKEIVWKASAQKSRGTLVHNALEMAMRKGIDTMEAWPDGIDVDFTRRQLQRAAQMVKDGAQLFIEHEITLNQQLRPAAEGWWAKDAFIRCKADAIIMPKDLRQPALIIDFKTGKKWDSDDFQLRLETLLLHLAYNRPVVNYEYWYVDVGDIEDGLIDYSQGLGPVADIKELIREMKQAIINKDFPPKRNKFCNWCDFNKTPACGL